MKWVGKKELSKKVSTADLDSGGLGGFGGCEASASTFGLVARMALRN